MAYVDITAPANWVSHYLYLYDNFGQGCMGSLGAGQFVYLGGALGASTQGVYQIDGGANSHYAWSGTAWVPVHAWPADPETNEHCIAGSGAYNGSFPSLTYVGPIDLSTATSLRLTVKLADSFTVHDTSASTNGPGALDIPPGAYTAGTTFVITGPGVPLHLPSGTIQDALVHLIAAASQSSGDNSTPSSVKPFIITKIEVDGVVSDFWTDFLAAEEVL